MIERAVVTGATGAIGTALVRELASRGAEVLVLAHKGSPRNCLIPSGEKIKIGYCDLDGLDKIGSDEKENFDAFFHLAWAGTTGSARGDVRMQEGNVAATVAAVDAAARLGCKAFVGVGSQAEYGRCDRPLTPETPAFPETAYGAAKLSAGMMARLEAERQGIKFNWVRVLSVYGPNDAPGSMIASALHKIARGERVELTAGEQIWDYLHSSDAATALRLVAERGKAGKTYVLGSGKPAPIREFIRIIGEETGRSDLLFLGAVPYKEGQVMHLEADITDLVTDTSFAPSVDFREGVRRLYAEILSAQKDDN